MQNTREQSLSIYTHVGTKLDVSNPLSAMHFDTPQAGPCTQHAFLK